MKIEPVIGYPNARPKPDRPPHTTPDACKGHDFYLDFITNLGPRINKINCRYRCRHCGMHFDFIDGR